MKRSRRTGASTSSRNLSGRDTRTPAGPGLGRSRILSTPGTRLSRELSALGPLNVWIGLKNSDDVGIRFDIRAEVYRSSTQLVGSGQSTSVSGGSSGFNNAKQDTIALTSAGGVRFMPGESLSIKTYVRNACSGSGKNAGTARVWFDDSSADSRLLKIGTSAATGPARDAARADVESCEVQWTPRHGREAFSGERRLPMTTGPPEAHRTLRRRRCP